VIRAAVLAGLLLASPALAQDDETLSGTLLAISGRGTIRIGVRDDAVPFSFRNPGGQPVGFSVDICHGIAEDVAQALHRDLLEPGAPGWQTGIRIAYVPVAANERVPMVVAHAIDLECGSTTANDERAKQVAFSPIFFVAGTKLAVPTGAGLSSWRDLAGKSVAVGAGTTNETVMKRLAPSVTPPLTIVSLPSVQAAFDALVVKRVQAMASDDILLAGMIAAKGGAFTVIGDYLSFEPYAIMLPRDDPQFAQLVHDSFARQAEAGLLRAGYNRWFLDKLPTGGALGLTMGPQLSEIYRAMGQPD
jgi:glutamate/aspartate transport system substrate-binding protein